VRYTLDQFNGFVKRWPCSLASKETQL